MSDYANDFGTFCVCDQLDEEEMHRALTHYFGHTPTDAEWRHNLAQVGMGRLVLVRMVASQRIRGRKRRRVGLYLLPLRQDVLEESAEPVQAAIALETYHEIKGGIRWRQKSNATQPAAKKVHDEGHHLCRSIRHLLRLIHGLSHLGGNSRSMGRLVRRHRMGQRP